MILYKYHNLNKHLNDLLSNKQFYCADRLQLNDPHDGLYLISSDLRDKLARNVIPNVRGHLSYNNLYDQIPDKLIMEFAKESFGDKEFYDFIHYSENKLSLNVCSFTELNDNELMWAHYSNNFQGVCLEFDFTKEPIMKNFVKIKYNNEIPKINKFAFSDIQEALSIKREAWSYEQEWRILHIDKFYPFSSNCLKSICFGPRTPNEQIENIIKICSQVGFPNVEFKRLNITVEGMIFE